MKMKLRKMVLETMEQFRKTLDYNKVIESAVHRGFYEGIGGEMDFPIPSVFDLITEAVGKVVSAKIKYDKKTGGKDTGEVEYSGELDKVFKGYKSGDIIGSLWFGFEMINGAWNIVLTNYQNGDSASVVNAGKFSRQTVKEIILTIIRLYDTSGGLVKYEAQVGATVDRDLEILFREGYISE